MENDRTTGSGVTAAFLVGILRDACNTDTSFRYSTWCPYIIHRLKIPVYNAFDHVSITKFVARAVFWPGNHKSRLLEISNTWCRSYIVTINFQKVYFTHRPCFGLWDHCNTVPCVYAHDAFHEPCTAAAGVEYCYITRIVVRILSFTIIISCVVLIVITRNYKTLFCRVDIACDILLCIIIFNQRYYFYRSDDSFEWSPDKNDILLL